MGNFNSQYFKDTYDSVAVHTESKISSRPGTPLPTPKHRILECDPRSPSTGEILRTPIEVSCYKQIEEISKDMAVLQLVDPRSPTYGIPRTPIQILASEVVLPPKPATSSESKHTYLETDLDLTPEEEVPRKEIIANTPNFALFMGADIDLSPISAPSPTLVASDTEEKQLPAVKQTQTYLETETAPVAKEPLSSNAGNRQQTGNECYTPSQTKNRGNRKRNDKENSANLKKQLFNTPEGKIQAVPKTRTPLGLMASANSPLHIIRGKQIQNVNKAIPTVQQSNQLRKRTTVD